MSPQPLEVEGPAGEESEGSCWIIVGFAAVRLPGQRVLEGRWVLSKPRRRVDVF